MTRLRCAIRMVQKPAMKMLRLSCVAAALLLAACSNYHSRWEKARVAKSGDSFEGAYAGKWSSASLKGGGGKLWCILEKTGPREYTAAFRATWHGVFASEHAAKLAVTKRSRGPAALPPSVRDAPSGPGIRSLDPARLAKLGVDVVDFRGGAEIKMWIGSGNYRCEGRLVGPMANACGVITGPQKVVLERIPARMSAAYDAVYDTGRFDLTKVPPR